jgi:ketosteroid isomerase-like protein
VSAENVELVRRGYEAFNQGDIQTTLALLDPRVEVHLAPETGEVLGPGLSPIYHGLDGFMEFVGQLQRGWQRVSWEPEDLLDAGDQVVVMVRMRARSRDGERELDQPMAHVCTMREGTLVRLDSYGDGAEALRAAGVEGV